MLERHNLFGDYLFGKKFGKISGRFQAAKGRVLATRAGSALPNKGKFPLDR